MWEEIPAHVAFSPKNPKHVGKNRKNNFVFTRLTSLSLWLAFKKLSDPSETKVNVMSMVSKRSSKNHPLFLRVVVAASSSS